MHPDTLFGPVTDASNFGDTQRRGVRSQNSSGSADFIEQGEYLNLRLHLFGHSLDYQIRLARGFFHAARVLQPAERSIRIVGGDLPNFNRLVKVATNFALRPA